MGGLTPRLAEPVLTQERVEPAARQAEELRGLRFVVAGARRRFLQQVALDRVELDAFGRKRTRSRWSRVRALLLCEAEPLEQHECEGAAAEKLR